MSLTRTRRITLLVILFQLTLTCGLPRHTEAEWYAGLYGGVSLDGRITNGSLPIFGQNQAKQLFPNPSPRPGDYLNSNFSLNDSIKLSNSAMFGGRVGYYFNEFGYPWAGLELEAFTTKPDIKAQNVTYTNTIVSNNTFLTTPPQPQTLVCPTAPGAPAPTCPSSLSIGEASLRVSTVALNAVARYPGKYFQPYVGVGVGLFYFHMTNFRVQNGPAVSGNDFQPGLNTFAGMKVFFTQNIALFGEYKYNRATINSLDNDVYGLKGDYSIMHLLGGLAYHF